MFRRRKYQEQVTYDAREKASPSEPSIDAWAFVEAVRRVVDAPQPPSGPPMILLAEEGSLADDECLPDNVTVVYYDKEARTPELLGLSY